MPKKETAKKGALTLEKLALYDDVLTDALVDKVGLTDSQCLRPQSPVLNEREN